ncbi:MAG: acyl-CoA dehydrogenase, partial [Actinomycetota bacterium]|nr:acyl-CoA dehydrogenase [Actinomycetota bacterium]
MILELGADAEEYGRAALRAFDAAGGDELVVRADADPAVRDELVSPVLRGLGAFDLKPRADADELEAAAALCRSAGYWALPYPVAECLSVPADLDADGLIVVAEHAPAGAVAGLSKRWAAVTLAGVRSTAVAQPSAGPGLVAGLTLTEIDADGADDVALGLTLGCWTLLG